MNKKLASYIHIYTHFVTGDMLITGVDKGLNEQLIKSNIVLRTIKKNTISSARVATTIISK